MGNIQTAHSSHDGISAHVVQRLHKEATSVQPTARTSRQPKCSCMLFQEFTLRAQTVSRDAVSVPDQARRAATKTRLRQSMTILPVPLAPPPPVLLPSLLSPAPAPGRRALTPPHTRAGAPWPVPPLSSSHLRQHQGRELQRPEVAHEGGDDELLGKRHDLHPGQGPGQLP